MFGKILVDLILTAFFVAAIVLGIKKGFFFIVAKPVKFVLAFVLAFSLCNWFAGTIVQPLIQGPLTNQITDYLVEKCSNVTFLTSANELPTLLRLAAGAVGLDVTTVIGTTPEEFIVQLVDKLAVPAIRLISLIISFFVTYLLAKLALMLVFGLLNSLFNAGIIGVLNKILGVVFNLLLAFIVVWGLTTLFGYIINLPSLADTGIAGFEGGWLYKFFKNISPIDLLLSF